MHAGRLVLRSSQTTPLCLRLPPPGLEPLLGALDLVLDSPRRERSRDARGGAELSGGGPRPAAREVGLATAHTRRQVRRRLSQPFLVRPRGDYLRRPLGAAGAWPPDRVSRGFPRLRGGMCLEKFEFLPWICGPSNWS